MKVPSAGLPRTRTWQQRAQPQRRLAAIHSLFRFAALHHPEHAAVIARVLAIPPKRHDRAVVSFLAGEEIDALLAAPDTRRWIGRRDHAILLLMIQTGLRVSELTGLCCGDIHLGIGAHLRCMGKGRKERCIPLTNQTIAALTQWLRERRGEPADPLFPTSRGRRLSRDAVALLVTKHANAAREDLPSPRARERTVTPSALSRRISARMSAIPAGSRPLVGSSRISKYGSLSRAAARPRRCFMPSE